MIRNGLCLAFAFAFLVAVGVAAPYGVSYSDGLTIGEKTALADNHADKKKKKKKKKGKKKDKKKRPAPR